MNIIEFTHDVFYVGVNDRTTEKFEGLWPLPNGVSYNSYIVRGDKIALIDTVHVSQCMKFLSNIKTIIGDSEIEYLVINHMEPDHSGSITMIRQQYPNIKIIGNAKTADMIKGFYCITEGVECVCDGAELDLGGKTLKFVFTPMVHWPETMMTFCKEDKVLFSGDAFGAFGALNGGIIDREMDTKVYFEEAVRYYSNIVAKYGLFVHKAIGKFNDVKIDYICPTHGPIWNEGVNDIIDLYLRLSQWDGKNGVVIAYASMYGNTEEVVELIARKLSKSGIKEIKIHNLVTTDISYVLKDICDYRGLILASPTYSNGLFPRMEALMIALKTREMKNRTVAYFGSHTWGAGALKTFASYLDGMKITLATEPFDVKQSMNDEDKKKCETFVEEFLNVFN